MVPTADDQHDSSPGSANRGERSTSLLTIFGLTAVAMTAFAANSLICRMGLRSGAIDPASYTLIRAASGAAMLSIITVVSGRKSLAAKSAGWIPAILLFLYAIAFSYAYLSLSAGSGALILFGVVQVTMILVGLVNREKTSVREWAGVMAAFAGLIYLELPGVRAPSLSGFLLMSCAGICWGLYSLRGRGESDPLAATTSNFLRAAPMALAAALIALATVHITARGVALAALSGGLASGCGYVVWYAALRHLPATRAAAVQLSVPVITAAGAVLFLSESLSPRLIIASVLVLGGIMVAMTGRARNR